MSDTLKRIEELKRKVRASQEASGDRGNRTVVDDMARLITELELYQDELVQTNEELRLTQAELERVGRMYFELYDMAPVGYLTLNHDGLIVRANLPAASLLNSSRARLSNRALSGFVHQDSLLEYTDCLKSVSNTSEPATCEVRLKSEDPFLYVMVNLRPQAKSALDEGELWCALTDITANKKLQAERQQLTNDLSLYGRQLELANRELATFNYSVSHDLRAPLRSIAGFTEALMEEAGEKLSGDSRDYLERIGRSVEHMQGIIEGLLTLSRITRADLRRQPCDLPEICREIIPSLRDRDPERRVEFLVPESIRVQGDVQLLRLVMDNLLANAWKFTLGTDSPRIEIGEEEFSGRRAVFVRDNGAGFDPNKKKKLFEAFQRCHAGEAFKGLGIGLTIVERAIRRHQGEVWAEGKKGRGATFYFTLEEDARG